MPPKPPEIIRKLQAEGWEKKSQKGSHVKLVKAGKLLIIPNHTKELKVGTWESIKKQAGWQ
jgi:mRNA interferase HicA